jgi:hypothetical protein
MTLRASMKSGTNTLFAVFYAINHSRILLDLFSQNPDASNSFSELCASVALATLDNLRAPHRRT